MSTWIVLADGFAVSLFGSVLSASFCNALDTRKKRLIFWCCALLLPMVQGILYSLWDETFLRQIYPLTMHLPLVLVLFALTRKPMWSLFCVFSAYLCCQLRRWFALLVVAIFSGGEAMQSMVQLLLTLPLMLLLLSLVSPAVRQLAGQPARRQLQFGVIPAIYYIFDYLTVVYTDLLISGDPLAAEFMPFVCCVAYLIFLLYNSSQTQKSFQLQQAQKVLDTQLTQSVREINALRESQVLASQYRHDLRHHLQYVSSCIEAGQTGQAQSYIAGICQEIENQKVQHYCENEAANLILSAFAGRAKKAGIHMRIQGTLPASIRITDSDLCVILSNALENALHSCQELVAAGTSCVIEVQFYQRDGKLFLQVVNPCREDISFENGIPCTDLPGHGIGVQSICTIVQRHGGIYTFAVQNGNFILRLSI